METINPNPIHLPITSATETSIKLARSLTEINSVTCNFCFSFANSSFICSWISSFSILFFFLKAALSTCVLSSVPNIVRLIAASTSFWSTLIFLDFLLPLGVSPFSLAFESISFLFLALSFFFFLLGVTSTSSAGLTTSTSVLGSVFFTSSFLGAFFLFLFFFLCFFL